MKTILRFLLTLGIAALCGPRPGSAQNCNLGTTAYFDRSATCVGAGRVAGCETARIYRADPWSYSGKTFLFVSTFTSVNIFDVTADDVVSTFISPPNFPWSGTVPTSDWDELQWDVAVADGYPYGIAMFQHYGWVSFEINNPASPTGLTMKKAFRLASADSGFRPTYARLFQGADSHWYAIGSYLDGATSGVSVVTFDNPVSPQLVAYLPDISTTSPLESAKLGGKWWVFVKRGDNVGIYDASSPGSLSQVATITPAAGRALTDFYVDKDSGRFYGLIGGTATTNGTLYVYDIAGLPALTKTADIPLGLGEWVNVAGNEDIAVATKRQPGIAADPYMRAFSVVNPYAPVEIAAGELNGSSFGIHEDDKNFDLAVVRGNTGNSNIHRVAYAMGTVTTISSSCLTTDPRPSFTLANGSTVNAAAASCGLADADGFPGDQFSIHDTSSGQIASGTIEIIDESQAVVASPTWSQGGSWTWPATPNPNPLPGLYSVVFTLRDSLGIPYSATKTIRLCGDPSSGLTATVGGLVITGAGSGLVGDAAQLSAAGSTGVPTGYSFVRQHDSDAVETLMTEQLSASYGSSLDLAGNYAFGVAVKYGFSAANDGGTCSDPLFANLGLGGNGVFDSCAKVGPIDTGEVTAGIAMSQSGTPIQPSGVAQRTLDIQLQWSGRVGTGITPSFAWSLTPGTWTSTQQNPVIPANTIALDGQYTVNLTVTTPNDSALATFPFTASLAAFGLQVSANPVVGQNASISVTSLSGGISAISVSLPGGLAACDGATSMTICTVPGSLFYPECIVGVSKTVKFGNEGSFVLTSTGIAAGSSFAGPTLPVTIGAGSCVTCPTLSASIAGPSSGSVGQNLAFTGSGSGATVTGYSWTAPGGSPASGSGASFTTLYSTTGTKTIGLTATFSVAQGCASTATAPNKAVTITTAGGALTVIPSKNPALPGETVLFSFSPTLSQTGDAISITYGDGGSGQITYPCPIGTCVVSHAYASPGTYTVSASGTVGGSGRSGSVQVTIASNCALPNAPVAAFGYSPSTVRATQPVQFFDQSTNTPTSWAWEFGDAQPPIFGGGTSSQQSPSYTFTRAGTFTVKLTATNCRGSSVKQQVITVLSACAESAVPVAEFDWAPKGPLAGFPTQQQPYVGQTVTLSDLSTNNPTAWHWYDFQGDPPTDFTTQNVTRTFSTAGNKNVRLTATNCIGTSTEKLKTLTVYPDVRSVTAEFTVSAEPFQTGTPVVFTARTGFDYGDPTSFTWRFSDDPDHPVTGSSVQHTFSCRGTAQVTLTAARGTYNDQITRSFGVDGEICGPESIVTTDAALVQGLNGTFWRTDLRAFNPSTEETRAYLAILPVGQNNADPFTAGPYHVPPKGTLVLNDILQMFALLGQSWQKAAIRLTYENVEDVAPIVVSRTYTNTTGGGTYGQSITGVPVRANTTANTLWLTGLHNDGLQDGFRTNFGLANLRGDAGVGDIVVRLYNAAGTEQTAETFGLAPYGYVQDRVANLFGASFESMGSFSLKVEIPQGVDVKPSASVVDNLTGDPVTVTGQEPPATRILVPSVARIRGEAGTDWHSDVQLTNPDRVAHTWKVEFLPKQSLPAAFRTVTVGPAQSLRLQRQGEAPDVVAWIYDPLQAPDASGVLRITSEEQSGVLPLVGARTYNLTASGTYGQGIPALSAVDGATPTGESRELLITGMSSEDWARSNLGFVNLGTGNVNFEVYFYDEFGNMLNPGGQAYPLFLGPGGWDQDKLENRALNQWGVALPSIRLISAVARVTSGGPGYAYASVVDSLTGDPVFVGGQLAP